MQRILKNIIIGSAFGSVEITSLNEESILNILVIRRKKKQLEIENELSIKDISEIKEFFNTSTPLILNINNNQVISKTLEDNLEGLNAINAAFPNLVHNDFYYEVYSNGITTFVSICRKAYIDSLISKIQNMGLFVVDFNLSCLRVSQITPFIEQKNISTSNNKISISEGKITAIENFEKIEDQSYSINGLSIKNKSVNGLASILCFYSNQNLTSHNYKEKTNSLQHDFEQSRIFNLVLTRGLGIILMLLLVNFLLFNNYTRKTDLINSELRINEDFNNSLTKLSEEVNKKKKIAAEVFSTDNTDVTFLVNKIGETIPESILLDELAYQPSEKNVKVDKEIKIRHQTIIIKGISKNNDTFSNWISLLEKEPWVDKVTVLNFGVSKSSYPTFEVNISILP
jgi:Tfp pilus assembly protein PilN